MLSRLFIYENNVGKGEIAGNQQFLLFPQCFYHIIMKDLSTVRNMNSLFKVILTMSSATALNYNQSKF